MDQEGLTQEEKTSHDISDDSLEDELSLQSPDPFDLTREFLKFPANRVARLQNLARADERFLLSLAYSTQRGYGNNHLFAGEIRLGEVEVVICPEELGFEVAIADIFITEVHMVNQFKGNFFHSISFIQLKTTNAQF